MSNVNLFILIMCFSFVHLSKTFANEYTWGSYNCSLTGTQQDMESRITPLKSIYFYLRHMGIVKGKNYKVYKKGFIIDDQQIERSADWERIHAILVPPLSQWRLKERSWFDEIIPINDPLLTIIKLSRSEIYSLIRSMGGTRLKDEHDLIISELYPDENNLYHFTFLNDETKNVIQLHLKPEEEKGLSFHLKWSCDTTPQAPNPLDIGDETKYENPRESYYPEVKTSESHYTENGFPIELEADPRALLMRFKISSAAWSEWIPFKEKILLNSDPQNLAGKQRISIQYKDKNQFKSVIIEKQINFTSSTQ